MGLLWGHAASSNRARPCCALTRSIAVGGRLTLQRAGFRGALHRRLGAPALLSLLLRWQMRAARRAQLHCRCAAAAAAAARPHCRRCRLCLAPHLLMSVRRSLTLQDATQKITEAAEALEHRQQLRDANLNPARPGAHSCPLDRLP